MADTATAPANEEQPVLITLATVGSTLREQAENQETTTAQIVDLTEIKRELEKQLKAVKRSLEPRHAEMLDTFAQRGETSARHAESGKLVYVNRQIWARADGEKADACEALRAAGLEAFVSEGFNTHSLSGYFREKRDELEAEGTPVTDVEALLPDELRGQIALTEDLTIGVRS